MHCIRGVMVCAVLALVPGCNRSSSGPELATKDDYWKLQESLNRRLIAVIQAGAGDCDKIADDMVKFYAEIEPTNQRMVAFEKDHQVWEADGKTKADALREDQRVALGACEASKKVREAVAKSPVLPTPSWAIESK